MTADGLASAYPSRAAAVTLPAGAGRYLVVFDHEKHIGWSEREILAQVAYIYYFQKTSVYDFPEPRQKLIALISCVGSPRLAPYRAMPRTAIELPTPTTWWWG
jgi:hypothetical protein